MTFLIPGGINMSFEVVIWRGAERFIKCQILARIKSILLSYVIVSIS